MNVIDRVESAKHTLTGSGLSKAVSKATSHEVIGPKRKHVDYIQHALELDNVSIPDTADMLFERCNNSSWVVVFKSLVTFHHLMSNANERFMQYVASKSTTWTLHNFLDKGGVQGYDMSHIIRRYSAYLAEKAYTYRTMGYDFCRASRGKETGLLRNMDTVKLLKALPSIQGLIDSLIATEVVSNDLTNGVITAAFMALFKDLIRLFACYNDGIINLLEQYFEMKKIDCKAGLEIYRRFLARMDRVADFLRVAEDAGINKGDIPDLTKAPHSLLQALEDHYQSLEKGRNVSPPTKTITLPAFDIEQFQSTSNGLSTATEVQGDYLKEQQKMLESFERKKKEEEARKLQQQQTVPSPLTPPQTQPMRQNFASTSFSPPSNSNKPSDDLLLLSSSNSVSINSSISPSFGGPISYGTPASNDLFSLSTQQSSINNQVNFNQAFRSNQSMSTPNLMDDDILTPEKQTGSSNTKDVRDGRLTGDLNKGLERIALSLDGLNVNPGTLKANTQKGHQWTSNQPSVRTGGANYQMSTVSTSTLPPTNYGMSGMMGQQYQQPMQPLMRPMGQPMMQPMMNPSMQPMMPQYGMQQGGMYNHQMMQGQQPVMYGGQMGQRLMMTNTSMMNDPFK